MDKVCSICSSCDNFSVRTQRYDEPGIKEFNVFCRCDATKDIFSFPFVGLNKCSKCVPFTVGLKSALFNELWVQCRKCYMETNNHPWSTGEELQEAVLKATAEWNMIIDITDKEE